MNYLALLTGSSEPLPIYEQIVPCLEDIGTFPLRLESLYREASGYDEPALDRLRFALVRVQVYADIHHTEDLERAQKMKYVSQVLERIIYGTLLLERDEGLPEG
jgi:hypothetical protein